MRFHSLILAAALAASPARAEGPLGFDPGELCYKQMSQSSQTNQLMMATWVMGFLAGRDGAAEQRPVDIDNMVQVMTNLSKACAGNSQMTLIDIVTASGPAQGGGSAGHARALLARFLAPGADRAALTAALKPTAEEIATVYQEPLAGELVAHYDDLFAPGVAIGPKEGQNDIYLVRTMTDNLIAGDPVLRDFPGGYADVVTMMKPGVPIARFKFVVSGETTGMAFDGLVFVNDRWVLMPKPWAAQR